MVFESLIEGIGNQKGLFEVALVLTTLLYVMQTVAQWKLFEKAGEKGWKALIPFYNIFVAHHLVGMSHFWFVIDIVFWVGELVLEISKAVPVQAKEVFLSVTIIVTIITELLHIMKLCYCYTKSERFGIGLFLCLPLFMLILAFDKSEYNPPRSHRGSH